MNGTIFEKKWLNIKWDYYSLIFSINFVEAFVIVIGTEGDKVFM